MPSGVFIKENIASSIFKRVTSCTQDQMLAFHSFSSSEMMIVGIMKKFFLSHPCLRKKVRYDTPIVLHIKLRLLLLNLIQQVPVGLTAISLIITGHVGLYCNMNLTLV